CKTGCNDGKEESCQATWSPTRWRVLQVILSMWLMRLSSCYMESDPMEGTASGWLRRQFSRLVVATWSPTRWRVLQDEGDETSPWGKLCYMESDPMEGTARTQEAYLRAFWFT